MNNSDFSNAKVGDKVTHIELGRGVITELLQKPYPIVCVFDGEDYGFTVDGKFLPTDFLPSLFKGHIDPESFSFSYKTIPPSNDQ